MRKTSTAFLRVTVLLGLIAWSAYHSVPPLLNSQNAYEEAVQPAIDAAEARRADFAAPDCDPDVAVFDAMEKQNDLMFGWAIAILAGIAAITTTTKVFAARETQLTYTLLGPTTTYLIVSTWAGLEYRSRVTFLLSKHVTDVSVAQVFLFHQQDFFIRALFWAAAFVAIRFMAIMLGASPVEERR
jgi:hypothetical protein